MEPKPPLKLTEQDLLKGIESRSIPYAQNLQDDLQAVLQCLIDNEKTLKINLDFFELTVKNKTYRDVSGWWAFWLNIPIRWEDATSNFIKIFYNKRFFLCFEDNSFGDEYNLFDSFFGDSTYGTLQERKTKAQYLRYATN